MARRLAAHGTVEAVLDGIVHLAVDAVEGCEFAGISLVQGRKVSPSAATGDVPRTIDEIQSEVDDGPCIEAIRTHEIVLVSDLEQEARWPEFSTRAHAETGVSSIVSFRLFVEEDTMGALCLFACQTEAFDQTDLAMGAVFAAHAALAMSGARREENLLRKAETRDLIGRAKGMLMEGFDLDDEGAFSALRGASQRLNRKLVDIADDVVHRRPIEDT